MKPKKCPKCKSDQVVPILYGLVKDHDTWEQSKRGELILGGVKVGPHLPTHFCKACHHKFLDKEAAKGRF
jgi:hypothetical protein